MAIEVLYPDALTTQTGLTGDVADIQEDADTSASDSNYLISNGATVCTLVATFPSPTGDPVNTQTLKVRLRQRDDPSGTQSVSYEVRDGATVIGSGTLDMTTGFTRYDITFAASALVTGDGSGLNLYLTGGFDGTPPRDRWSWEISALEWNVEYTTGATPVEVGLTGLSATSAASSAPPDRAAPVAGQSVIGAAGTPAALRSAAIAGVEVSGLAGVLAATTAVEVGLTGISATSASWSLSLSREAATAGQAASGAAGVPAALRSASIGGFEVSGLAGAAVAAYLLPVAGHEVSAQAGAVALARLIALSGASASASTGAVSVTGDVPVEVSLSGLLATTAYWTATPDRAGPLNSALSSALAGDIVASRSRPLAGVLATSASSIIVPGAAPLLVGQAATAAGGALSASRDCPCGGAAAITAVGALSPMSGDQPRYSSVG